MIKISVIKMYVKITNLKRQPQLNVCVVWPVGGSGLSGEENLVQLEVDMLKTQLAQRDRELAEVDKLAR